MCAVVCVCDILTMFGCPWGSENQRRSWGLWGWHACLLRHLPGPTWMSNGTLGLLDTWMSTDLEH